MDSSSPDVRPALAQAASSIARTDNSGRYRIDVPPGDFHIAAGYVNPPTFYPGVADVANATPVTARVKTAVDKLDFVIPPLPPSQSVSGRVLTKAGLPLAGTEVKLRSTTAGIIPGILELVATVGADGAFRFREVLPGAYQVTATVSGTDPAVRDATVANMPVTELDFAFSVGVARGRLLWEDGTPFLDPVRGLAFMAETVDEPNIASGTILPIADGGTFTGSLKAGVYRFHLRSLSADYSIVSITAGSANLLADALRVDQTTVADVEVRVRRRLKPMP